MDTQILIVAVFFFGMGLCALFYPSFVVGFFSMRADHHDAQNEVRAVYGGFGIAIAGLLLSTHLLKNEAPGILLAVSVALIGMAGGRIISAIKVRPGLWPVVFFFVELGLASLLLTAN